jgi:predicted outer membrane repeat protein
MLKPIFLPAMLAVQNATTLIIEPGVVVEFQGHYKLIVEGKLLAVGTQTDTIEFTVNDTTGLSNTETTDGSWHGIRFKNNTSADSSKLVYCKIQFGKATDGDDETDSEDDNGGGIYINDFSKLRIENCLIDHNIAIKYGGGIYAFLSELIISTNYAKSGGGICCEGISLDYGHSLIINNYIKNNEAHLFGGGIYSTYSKPNIIGNEIDENISFQGGGIYIDYYDGASIERNKIRNNSSVQGGGVFLRSVWPVDFLRDMAVEFMFNLLMEI